MSAVALSMTAISQAKAGEPLLSPRAQSSQIHKVAGMNNDVKTVQTSNALLSPRAQGNQIAKVAGTNNDVNLVKSDYYTTGTPRGQQPAPTYQIAPVK